MCVYLFLIPEVLEKDGVTGSFENANITEDVTDIRDKFRSGGGPRKETTRCSSISKNSKAKFGVS